MQVARDQSLVRELDPARCYEDQRSHVPPLTQCSQMKKREGLLSQNSVCMLPNAHEKPYDSFLFIYNFIFILLKCILAAPGLRGCGSHWVGVGLLIAECRLWGLAGRSGTQALQHVGSSWTRRQICVPCIGRWIRNHWTTRDVPCDSFLSLTPKHPSSSHQLRKLNKLHSQSPL